MNDLQRIALGKRHVGERRARHDVAIAFDRDLLHVEPERGDEIGDAAAPHLPLFAVEDDRNARHAINNLRIPERRRGARSSEARTSVVAASTSLGKAPRLRSGMREH